MVKNRGRAGRCDCPLFPSGEITQMSVKLIAIDLDGTLLKSDHMTMPPENITAMEKAIKKGIHVVPATGRTLYDIPEFLRKFPGIKYMITSNGAEVRDIETGDVMCSSPVPLKLAYKVLAAAVENHVYTEVYSGGKAYIQRSLRSEKLEKSPMFSLFRLLSKREETESLADFISQNPAQLEKIELLAESAEAGKAVSEKLKNLPLMVTTSGMNSVEITSCGTSKAVGLKYLCGILNIKPDEVMAIGDSMNDMEMLDFAGISAAVENADEELKAIASFITKSNNECGVAFAIEKYL
jgi:Cof subfamily protein (haloacid dehalogenase superfamily)